MKLMKQCVLETLKCVSSLIENYGAIKHKCYTQTFPHTHGIKVDPQTSLI